MVGSLQTFEKKETILPSAMVGYLCNPNASPKRKLKVYELYQPYVTIGWTSLMNCSIYSVPMSCFR